MLEHGQKANIDEDVEQHTYAEILQEWQNWRVYVQQRSVACEETFLQRLSVIGEAIAYSLKQKRRT